MYNENVMGSNVTYKSPNVVVDEFWTCRGLTQEKGSKKQSLLTKKRSPEKIVEEKVITQRGKGRSGRLEVQQNYKILYLDARDFDRHDVEELYRLVKEWYRASSPEGYDLMLWGDLHTMFEPNEDDELWKNQHQYNLLSWSLYDFCGIHMLLMENGMA
ncbi:hypothetical protein Tco_1301648 [Tanacetum coccineum]